MATDHSPPTRDSNTQLLDELQALSQSMYSAGTRRTASLALPRSSLPEDVANPSVLNDGLNKPRSRRMSLSPWRSRANDDDGVKLQSKPNKGGGSSKLEEAASTGEADKKGIWNWKPMRALSHIRMNKMSCLFSVEVVTLQGLPASMNGLRLSVCVRKKETRDGAVNTMPSRVSQGAADFEETLFLKCHVYYTTPPLKIEPRPFSIYAFAVDAQQLHFGKNSVDLSKLIQESMEKNQQGTRVRQWDLSFDLEGKAKGGELLVKLGFQIMEKDGGIGIYNQPISKDSPKSGKSFGRNQSKTSFSVLSPRLSSQTPSQSKASTDLPGMDELNLDEPAPIPSTSSPSVQKSEEESKIEDLDLPDFEVVDKGIEIQDDKEEQESEKSVEEEKSSSSEVVKEVVLDQAHLNRLSELDSIAQQIKALESMMEDEKIGKTDEESDSQRLDADEENVTMEFLQMLEREDDDDKDKLNYHTEIPHFELEQAEDSSETESKSYISDLGKGLGCVVQTRDGGYLAAMNPLNVQVSRKDTPKLAMQISKPFIIAASSTKSATGFELFQRMACNGVEELSSKVVALMSTDELMGKTAEQIAFEGIASAIIQGRNKEEGVSTKAARAIATVKSMATALSTGRKERISTGIWNIKETPISIEEILALSMQKLEEMSVEALKVQAEMEEEEAPFDVSGVKVNEKHPLDCAVPFEDWMAKLEEDHNESVTIGVVVQLRDPLRRYEAVGGPVVAVIHAKEEDDEKFKVTSLHVGGLKVRKRRNSWDSEKHRLTAMQWLLAYGIGKVVKKGKNSSSNKPDLLWSLSSRVMADMWLKQIRNPDVKFLN